jgi:hypothetical protein
MKSMRILGIAIVVIALVAAVVPALYNCSAGGKMLTTTAGKQVPMKCYWTAQASIAIALPLGLLGLVLAFSRRKETQRALAIVAAGLGVTVILLPTYLIGTCASYDMICNLVEKPTMIGLGILTVVVAAVVFFLASRPEQETAE